MTNKQDQGEQNIYTGKIIRLKRETVTLPNDKTIEMEIIEHPGGAAVVAINQDHQVCLLRQYRHVANGWLWELPAGKIDHQEPPLVTAKRELQEEAGITAQQWHELGRYYSSPGVFNEIVYLYLALELRTTEMQHEADEVMEVHWIPFNDAISMVLDDQLNDGKSAVALLRAQALLKET